MINTVILCLLVGGCAYASYTDLKSRRVPNWLSMGLIVTILALRACSAVYYKSFSDLLLALMWGVGFFYAGVVLFYAGKWGGGDLKLFVAVGVGLRVYWVHLLPVQVVFLLVFPLLGACYSLFYSVVLKREEMPFIPVFLASLLLTLLLSGWVF